MVHTPMRTEEPVTKVEKGGRRWGAGGDFLANTSTLSWHLQALPIHIPSLAPSAPSPFYTQDILSHSPRNKTSNATTDTLHLRSMPHH